MAPKAAQKAKEPEPQTPKSKTKRKADSPYPSATPTPKKKVKKEAPPTTKLAHDDRAPASIDVAYEGEPVAGSVKDGKFGMTLKLEDQGAFSLVKTLVFTEGEFEGYQAIILKPAKSFPFTRLPENVRQRVYEFYLAPKGIITNDIVLEGCRANKDVYAKSYAEGSKNRVGLLAANKLIYNEATPILYASTLKLENTTSVVEFMAQSTESMKLKLTSVEIKNYVKTQSKIAMHNLSNAPNLRRLHIESGVTGEGDPVKAAKAFWADASKFLGAMSGRMGVKGAGIDVLSFGKQALTTKEGKGGVQPWSDAMKKEFIEALRAKMV